MPRSGRRVRRGDGNLTRPQIPAAGSAPANCFVRPRRPQNDRPEPIARRPSRLRFVAVAAAVLAMGALVAAGSTMLHAQGPVEGAQKGAREGNKAAGPIGGVLAARSAAWLARSGVVGASTGGGNQKNAPAQSGAKQDAAKDAGKDAKSDASKGDKSKAARPVPRAPSSAGADASRRAGADRRADRLQQRRQHRADQKELNLTPEQEKHWSAFNSAMHYLGHNGADRLKLRVARAQRDPPDDIIEQNAQRGAIPQRSCGRSAQCGRCRRPLFSSLDDKQKADLHQ